MTMMRIDLGLAPHVRLGRLTLDPAMREIRRDDGAEEVVEPRIMQVLLALAEARGEIVRREALTERCWEGRIVGEDAINRVLSRLRRVAEGIGEDSFRIETITRIGYRLVELDGRGAEDVGVRPARPSVGSTEPTRASRLTRRGVLAGAAAAGGLALAGGGVWWRTGRSALSAPARVALAHGNDALRYLTLDQLSAAATAFRQAAELAPDAAEPWGRLAFAYSSMSGMTHGQEARLDIQRAREAAGKALRLDPDNADAQAALATLATPSDNCWLAFDAASKPVIARHPDAIGIGIPRCCLLFGVGRIRELDALARRLTAQYPDWPCTYKNLVWSNWCSGRLDDADAAMERAFQQWPRSEFGIWFSRQRLLAYTGRAAAAIAMIEDVDHRPLGIPDWDFDMSLAESRALLTRSRADIETAAAFYWKYGRTAAGFAGNAAEFFAAVGRLDDAFAFLEALYFGRGFDIGERLYSKEQGIYSRRGGGATWHFWFPHMAELRADSRTAAIVRELGLAEYWRKSGTRPDLPIAGFMAA